MENIDNMAKNSLKAFSREALTDEEQKRIRSDIFRALIALSCLGIGLVYTGVFPNKPIVPALFYTVGFLVEGVSIFVNALKGIIARETKNSMEILVGIAIIACYCTGELILAVLIPLILNIAHFLEERSIVGGREIIDGLKKMNKNTATLIVDGVESEVPSESLKKGQEIVVKPGENIPIDGVVVKGSSSVDQKSLTGEPKAVFVEKGSGVYAGTINLDSRIVVRVEKEFVDTSFSKIVSLLEEAENIETPETRLIDRFMKYYIPFVLLCAVATALFTGDSSKAIAILVVACPCGQMLVSSAPMISALSVAVKRGILIKNSKFIEELTEVDAVVFDKTGTITRGDFTLTGIKTAGAISENELIKEALSVAKSSNHPIARTLSKNYENEKGSVENLEIREFSGKGLVGISQDKKTEIIFGNRKLLEENNVDFKGESNRDDIGSISYVAKNKVLLGEFIFDDVPRDEAINSIKDLKKIGTRKVVILTGDRKLSAQKICEEVGADKVEAELLPIDKLEAIKNIKEENIVLAVGDGINDALALKEADVGIAMGAMGSDVAIESADIALMNNNLENIPFAIRLAHHTKKVIYQNLILSSLISLTMIVLSGLGYISVLAGSILHNLGAFMVLLNSSRILNTDLWTDEDIKILDDDEKTTITD